MAPLFQEILGLITVIEHNCGIANIYVGFNVIIVQLYAVLLQPPPQDIEAYSATTRLQFGYTMVFTFRRLKLSD